ncbi:DUF4180 domain-containing protein [Pedobacter hiemivivus]|uniref:DUF4180 domain-containing protein n=1 Tax=Pedobacter hiemivivus TaxID=2530454 RepID=A0A4R0N4D9_9SPHI|nr:DUF4180 domain-containing protein [Pedobacter hiemivivus]TCC94788.1 DUF4180 domain-containing protein [Pedobacter hiemivivus]
MRIISHQTAQLKTAEIISDDLLIVNAEDTLQLIVDIYYQGFDRILLFEKNVTPDFFDLKTRLAGEILQKFINYKMRLIIVGDFSKYSGQSLKDFIYESNKGKQINFLASFSESHY